MRFIVGTTDTGRPNDIFLVQDERAFNLSQAHPGTGPDLMRLITDPALMARIRAEGLGHLTMPASTIRPALPVAHPGKVICLGLNYVDHVKEGGYDIPTYPALFIRTLTSLIPAGA